MARVLSTGAVRPAPSPYQEGAQPAADVPLLEPPEVAAGAGDEDDVPDDAEESDEPDEEPGESGVPVGFSAGADEPAAPADPVLRLSLR